MTTVSSARLQDLRALTFITFPKGNSVIFEQVGFYYRSRLQGGWSKMLNNCRQGAGCGGLVMQLALLPSLSRTPP